MNHQSPAELTELAELRQTLGEQPVLRGDRPSGPGPGRGVGEPEAASRREARKARDALCAAARVVLADVEAALRPTNDGSYGNRLRIVPQARCCSPCHRSGVAGR
ncbi:hypothetical protein [Streptomyces sp. MP131-18]|uniref:hypothetical protein n=1 Tax=Streptomyces sp. MP131-18 TaxID=1857892 RepID=UPI00097C78F0|nr:hypothetical protein [Streptomyces sp. MP131-18]ONK11232.1 hypothetical protein STBA_19620 [Streptomyces sp. MP131-18]